MAKISLSFSQLLNVVLGVVVLTGSILSYRYGNFGGVSFDELTLYSKNLEEGTQNSEKSLKSVILKLNEKIATKESQIKDLELKITAMQSEKQKTLEKLDKQLTEYIQAVKENYDTMQFHTNELKVKNDAKEKEIQELKTTLLALKTDLAKIKALETVTPEVASPITKEAKGQKLMVLDKVTCTDMETGTNALSDTCKQSVQAFLAKYDDSYLFEVAPIVDNGGFASLKLIKSKKVGVEDIEIDRIAGLANIGLGKARAKAGGELIEAKFGESAKISYALSNIEQDKARGFQIRVLK